MRRPIVFAAIAFGTGMCISFLLKAEVLVWLVLFVLSAGVWLHCRRKETMPLLVKTALLFLCILFLGGALIRVEYQRQDPLEKRAGTRVSVVGVVKEIKEKGDGFKILLDTGESRVLISSYQPMKGHERLAGKVVRAYGMVTLPDGRRNPACFDYRLYLRTLGVRTLLTAERMEILGGETTKVAALKSHFLTALRKTTDKEIAGVLNAMLFGDKSMLEEDVYESFQRNGTAHILAVSGLHVGIVYAFFCFIWRQKRGLLFYGAALCLLFFYATLAGFSPSVMRAGIMIALHLLSKALHCRYDLLSAAAFTFILMLSINPMQLFHVGFQLSFLAIVSLGVFIPFIKGAYSGVFLSGIAIQLGTGPYVLYVFNYVSCISLLANLPILLFAGILIPLGILLIPLSFLSQTCFGLGAEVLEQGCRIMIALNDLTYAEGKFSFDFPSPSVFFLIAYYGVLFFCCSEKGRILFIRKQKKLLGAMGILILATAILFSRLTDEGFSEAGLVFVDVGQGDCLHIKTPEGKNYLIDGGGSANYDVGKKTLKPYLLKNGVSKIDVAFVTHLHADHYGGIASLKKEGMIEKVAVYAGNQGKEFSGQDVLLLRKGQRVRLGAGIFLDVVYPAYTGSISQEEDENQTSLIMRLRYGKTAVLMTGDIDQGGESAVMEANRDMCADILKIAHHGSKYSTSESFLEAVAPAVSVIQVGRNNFGHPTPEVLEKCRKKGIMVYRNDRDGALGICGLLDYNKKFYVKRIRDGRL